ncbi:DUF4158 domain-containing protein [Nocardia tengchongensis]|uniref:DUF4158 domain-containing protein n=1 Tax=Nocardia tengchongensis TaxID=2055889 RepID=UPI003D1615BD
MTLVVSCPAVRDEGVSEYGRFPALSRVELERFFHLDDEDRKLIADRRRDYNKLGFALQLSLCGLWGCSCRIRWMFRVR